TAEWAGKDTSYAPDEKGEYQMLIDWVKITPQSPDNSTESWPGSKYLKQMETGTNGGSGKNEGVSEDDANSGGSRVNNNEGNSNALSRSPSAAQMGGSAVLMALTALAFFE
ncbi:hypothetical protein BGZ65_012762, partial [Modicella reniformis]